MVSSHTGYRAWNTQKSNSKRLLTGFSHGAAGISFSLLKLYEEVGDDIFFNGAKEAIEYEQSVFDIEKNNWPDYRMEFDGSYSFVNSWCHGATGIGLARVSGYNIFNNSNISLDINNSLKETINYNFFNSVDHLCCGNFGRINFLLEAFTKLNRKELSAIISKKIQQIMDRYTKIGYYKLFHNVDKCFFRPDFFQGISGIGYELLRLSNHNDLPNILVLE